MSFLTVAELARRSESELGALVHSFNAALACCQPFSREWNEARAGVDAALTERRRRIERPWRQSVGPG